MTKNMPFVNDDNDTNDNDDDDDDVKVINPFMIIVEKQS